MTVYESMGERLYVVNLLHPQQVMSPVSANDHMVEWKRCNTLGDLP